MASSEKLQVVLFSFGFKYGTPVNINFVFDVRFLPNPYWVEELRPKTGCDTEVADYIMESNEGITTIDQFESFYKFLVEKNISAGKESLRIGIGCTGGRHRSVAVTEKIAQFLKNYPVDVNMFHRDIEKDRIAGK